MNKFARIALPASVLGFMGSVHAALPTGFEAKVTEYQTDIVGAFGLLIAAGIAVYGVRKLGQKLGLL